MEEPGFGRCFSPTWEAQAKADWVHGAGWVEPGADWNLAQQWQYLDSLPNECFQQSSSYSTQNRRLMDSGGSSDMDFYPNRSAQADWSPGAGFQPRPGWGKREGQDHGQRNWNSEDGHGQREFYSGDEYKSWNIDGQPGFRPRMSKNNSAASQASMSQFESSELKGGGRMRGKGRIRWGKDKIVPKRLQDTSHHSRWGRNKLVRGLKAAGKSIKESFQEQVEMVKNLVKPKVKEKSFSEVLSNEGVLVGLTLDSYLIEAGEVEKAQREQEENQEEDLLLWEEGWGGDFRLKTAGEQEEEDLRSPNWDDVKEVRNLT